MALKIKTNTQFGVELDEAYAKIICFNGNKETVDIMVGYYADANARELNMAPIKSENFNFVFNEDSQFNIIKQGYEYLKTLDEFKDAEDC